MKWLHMAVTLSSISIGVLAFSSEHGLSPCMKLILDFSNVPLGQAQYFALMILPLSLLFVFYALWTFLWRGDLIRGREATRYFNWGSSRSRFNLHS